MAGGTVFSTEYWDTLKPVLEKIITDRTKVKLYYPQWMKRMTMSDAYEDDKEVGGPGLAQQMGEGQEIPVSKIANGYTTRYQARKFGLRMDVTDEMVEDSKYQRMILKFADRLRKSMHKTVDFDCTDILVFAWDANYPGGDGQPLFSASHTLPHGGTFSNNMATPLAPSIEAISTARTALRKMPDQSGIIEGYEIDKVIAPVDQETVWQEIRGSEKDPENGNFSRINVASGSKIINNVVLIPYWSNTTTNYCFTTDCDDGFNIRVRRDMRVNTWVHNSNETASTSVTMRQDNGYSDARCAYGVQA